jgi:hypothetical protein
MAFSNAVTNADELRQSRLNASEKKMLEFGSFWMQKRLGEQEL